MWDYLHRIEGIVVLDNEGKRVFAKYWTPHFEARAKQTSFEKSLYSKTATKRSAPAEKAPEAESKASELKTLISLTRGSEKKESSSLNEAGDIILMESRTVLFRFEEEAYFYVIGGPEENEVVLSQVLSCFFDTLCQLLKHNLEKKVLLENYELMILAVDEMIDDGIILEINPQSVFTEVSPHASTDHDSPLTALHSMAKIVKQNL
eukprot:TRINITY_DN7387_c0_g1_i1.p1 TRINITY_DN7387_c0_g1~~TRINITY_DN7387_c0_g1_i1.p1  ORF type:complete len:206 (+),score=32.36 TRINITY_DN7387_c0_g1_i1:64-681(+)